MERNPEINQEIIAFGLLISVQLISSMKGFVRVEFHAVSFGHFLSLQYSSIS